MVIFLAAFTPFWAHLAQAFDIDAKKTATAHPIAEQISAESLTHRHDWPRFATRLAQNTLTLPQPDVVSILHNAPASETNRLRAALRERLRRDPRGGLTLVDPARSSPFSGKAVCDWPNKTWRNAVLPKVRAVHDLSTTYQRADCLGALDGGPISKS